MFDITSKLYNKIPTGNIKTAIERIWGSLPENIRFGRGFQQTLIFLEESEWWSEDRLIDYQLQQLKRILTHSVDTVHFYRKNYKDWGIAIDRINDLSQLKQIPIMSKDIMRTDINSFLSNKYKKNELIHATTSGSSGQTFDFYKSIKHSAQEWAFITHLWSRVGFSNRDWRIVMRGPIVDHSEKGIYWQHKPKNKELILSTYHMSDENMLNYLKIIKESGYDILHCHPSSGLIFANFLKNNNITCPLRAVLVASEAVYPFQRKIMEEVFQCRVYSFYGQSEQVCIAGECEESEIYHIQPEYGITEILDVNGNELKSENEIGEIIATGFINDAMPFIRYRTGDLATISNHKCSCGRNHRLIKRIEGRDHEYIVTRDGRVVSLTGLIHGQHFLAFSKIKKLQFYQRQKGEIEIRIVKNPGFSVRDETEISRGIMKCLIQGIELKFVYLNDIPVSTRGKHKFLIQEVKIDFLKEVNGIGK